MKTAFIIRFHYEKNDPRFEWRFEYFKNEVLPRILNQTEKNFDIAIRCNSAHDNLFLNLSPRIRVFHVKNESAQYKGNYFFDFVPWSDVLDLPKYEIQLGLDSDDLIERYYVEDIFNQIEKILMKLPNDEPVHICFQPELFDVKTQRPYRMPQRYSLKKGSAFFAIFQPEGTEPYRFAYEESHLTIGLHFENRLVLPSGSCFASCHEFNESTHV
jgi:hypothetical protein